MLRATRAKGKSQFRMLVIDASDGCHEKRRGQRQAGVACDDRSDGARPWLTACFAARASGRRRISTAGRSSRVRGGGLAVKLRADSATARRSDHGRAPARARALHSATRQGVVEVRSCCSSAAPAPNGGFGDMSMLHHCCAYRTDRHQRQRALERGLRRSLTGITQAKRRDFSAARTAPGTSLHPAPCRRRRAPIAGRAA